MSKKYDGYINDIYRKVNKIFMIWSIFIFMLSILLAFIFCFEQNEGILHIFDITLHTIVFFLCIQIIPVMIYFLVLFIVKKNIRAIDFTVDNENSYFRDCLDLPISILGILYNYKLSDYHLSAILIDLEYKGEIDCSGDCISIVSKDGGSSSSTCELFLDVFNNENNYDIFREKFQNHLLTQTRFLGYLTSINIASIFKIFKHSCFIFVFTILLSYFLDDFFDMGSDFSYLCYLINYIVKRVSFIFSIVSFIFFKYRKKTPFIKSGKGVSIYRKLMALKNYIHDFGSLDNLPVQALEFRGDFYVYSVMFGYNKEVTESYIQKLKETFKKR